MVLKAVSFSEITKGMRKGPGTELTAPMLRDQGHKEKPAKGSEKLPERQEENQEGMVSRTPSEDSVSRTELSTMPSVHVVIRKI